MASNIKRLIIASLLLFCVALQANAATETRFTVVDSSPTSWVARGLQDYTVTPTMGWSFNVSRNFDNGISFNITGTPISGTTISLWFLDFAAPFDADLTQGLYEDFEGSPFQDAQRPGLAFGSSGRQDNIANGFFEILEVTYDGSGNVLSFAADFLHFGETNSANWAMVELRYNATVVPLPGAAWLLISGLVSIASFRGPRSRIARIYPTSSRVLDKS